MSVQEGSPCGTFSELKQDLDRRSSIAEVELVVLRLVGARPYRAKCEMQRAYKVGLSSVVFSDQHHRRVAREKQLDGLSPDRSVVGDMHADKSRHAFIIQPFPPGPPHSAQGVGTKRKPTADAAQAASLSAHGQFGGGRRALESDSIVSEVRTQVLTTTPGRSPQEHQKNTAKTPQKHRENTALLAPPHHGLSSPPVDPGERYRPDRAYALDPSRVSEHAGGRAGCARAIPHPCSIHKGPQKRHSGPHSTASPGPLVLRGSAGGFSLAESASRTVPSQPFAFVHEMRRNMISIASSCRFGYC